MIVPQEMRSADRNWLPAIYFSGVTLAELCVEDLQVASCQNGVKGKGEYFRI